MAICFLAEQIAIDVRRKMPAQIFLRLFAAKLLENGD
jgi:hypothetical protein